MSATFLLSVARVAVAISTVAALLAHAWLTVGHPWLPTASIVALATGFLGGWVWRRSVQATVLALAHVWPLITFLALGIVEPLTIMVWVTALTSLALATSPLTRWSLPPRWQVPIAAWGMLLSLAWPIMLARELDFTLITYFQNDTLLGLWAGPLRYSVAFVVSGSAIALASIVVLDWLWFHYGRLETLEPFFREVAAPLTIGTVIALGVGVYQGIVDLDWLNIGQWPRLGRAVGTFFDANAFGAVAAVWAAPIAGAAMLAERRVWRVIGLVLLSLAAVAVWACGSRTALLGLLPAFAGIAIALARAGRLSRLTTAIAVLAIVSTITVGWLTGGPGSGLRRVWDTLPSLSAESVTRFTHAMWTRDGYGAASVDMLREFPLTGVGSGAFPLLAPGYVFRLIGRPVPPDNAQNWWRHQVTELGLVAGLIPLACSLLVFFAIVGAMRHGRPPVGVIPAAGLIGAGLMSIVGSPAAHPLVLLTITVLIFWTLKAASLSDRSAGSYLAQAFRPANGHPATLQGYPTHDRSQATRYLQPPNAVAVLAVVWLLPVLWSAATAWTAVYELRPPFRAEAIGWVYTYGIGPPEALGPGSERRWVAHRAVGVVPSVATRLVLTFTAAPEALASGPIGLRVFTRDRMLLDQPLSGEQTATTAIELAGRKWTMVQIETSRRGVIVDGFERAVQLTTRLE